MQEHFNSCCEKVDNPYVHSPTTSYEVCISLSLISASYGWVMVWDLSDIINGDNPFEPIFIEEEDGTIDCYKTEYDLFIIRTHFRGLITALTIFKEWTEVNRLQPSDN